MEDVGGKHEQHLLAETIAGMGILALVMLGVGMTVYRFIAPEGWLAQLFGRSVSDGVAALVSTMVIGFLAWVGREWITPAQRNRYADFFVFAFAAAGFAYLVQLGLKGIF